jgi:hypothetical protein
MGKDKNEPIIRDGFVFYRSFYEAISDLEPEDKLEVLELILNYGLDGVQPNVKGFKYSIFKLVKPQIDSNNRKYINGLKGGKVTKANQGDTKANQSLPKEKEKDKVKEKEKEDIGAAGFDIFWELYPRQRRGDKTKSYDAYCKALEKDTPENILDGLKDYSKSDEVAKGYAKGCQAWLNDSRWLNDYNVGAKPTPLFDKDKIVLW